MQREVTYRKLSREAFGPYGRYEAMLDPRSIRIGAPPIEFYRDMIQANLGPAHAASFGVCRVEKRPYVINVSEYHDRCPEVIMPLDGDVLMHVAPAVPEKTFPLDSVEVFLVPKGTLAVLSPGVWHHGPYTLGNAAVNCLVMLPERTYMTDCTVYEFAKADWVTITGTGLE